MHWQRITCQQRLHISVLDQPGLQLTATDQMFADKAVFLEPLPQQIRFRPEHPVEARLGILLIKAA